MCVIATGKISQLKNLTKRDWSNAWDSNPHGAGILIVETNELFKTMEFKEFIEKIEEIKSNTNEEFTFVAHLRFATHGNIDINNVHPFTMRFKDNVQFHFFHNGVFRLYDVSKKYKNMSDTFHKASILRKITSHYFEDIGELILNGFFEVKSGNKVVIVYNKKVHMYGDFYKYKGITVSNTYSFRDFISSVEFGEIHSKTK